MGAFEYVNGSKSIKDRNYNDGRLKLNKYSKNYYAEDEEPADDTAT